MIKNFTGFVSVRGAREHNLKDIELSTSRRDALVVFTGVSGSGKSSLAFGTLYAEAQRRYLESVSPYAQTLVRSDGGAGCRRHRRAAACGGAAAATRVADHTLVSRERHHAVESAADAVLAGRRPIRANQPLLYAESFSPNTPEGACPRCHGLGRVYEVTERSMVPDDSLTIRERAVAAWPTAWQGQNLRDILVTLGLRRRSPMARSAEERSPLDSLHRRAAHRSGVCRLRTRRGPAGVEAQGGAELHGHLHQRTPARPPHLREHAERDDEKARRASTC